MSKDEYLITDTPLKALTVFAMPMILGSFFQQICFHLCGIGGRCRCRCAREPLFRCQGVWKNEDHRVNVLV